MRRITLCFVLCLLMIYPVVGSASATTNDELDEFEFFFSLDFSVREIEDLPPAVHSSDCVTLYQNAQELINQKKYGEAQKILALLYYMPEYHNCPLRSQIEAELSYVKALRCLEKMNFFSPVYSFKRLNKSRESFVVDKAKTLLMEILKKHPDFYRIQEVKEWLNQVNIDLEVERLLTEKSGLVRIDEVPLDEWKAKVEKEEILNLRDGFKEILKKHPEYYRGAELRYGAVKCLYLAGEKEFIDEAEALLSKGYTPAEKELRRDLYLCLADAYASAGDREGMIATIEKIKKEYPDLVNTVKFKLVVLRSYNKLLTKNGVSDIETVKKSSKEMREIALEGIKLMLAQNNIDYFGDYIGNIRGYYCQLCPQIDLDGNYKKSVNPELCEKYRDLVCAELGKAYGEIFELITQHLNQAVEENSRAKLETAVKMGKQLFMFSAFTICESDEFTNLCEKWVTLLRNNGRRFLQEQKYEFADIVYGELIHSLSLVDSNEPLLEVLLEGLQGFPEGKIPSRILKESVLFLAVNYETDMRFLGFLKDKTKKQIILKKVKSLIKEDKNWVN